MECFKLPEHYFGARQGVKADQQKVQDMANMLEQASSRPLRPNTYLSVVKNEQSKDQFWELLSENGIFSDLEKERTDWSTAIKRLTYMIMTEFHGQKSCRLVPEKLLRGVIYYGKQELEWEQRGPIRFHDSCFALPVCAVNLYFSLLPELREIEKKNDLWISFYNVLCGLMLQAWTLPERGDETDQTPFDRTRFQGHVWWQGGNALAYRPVFYTALCFGDSRLMDVLGEVIIEASASRAAKGETAFWSEGICADGFGWGHGAQAYNSGYPTDSLREIFDIIVYFKHTAFEPILKQMDWENILRYTSSISWSSYGTYIPPMMGRVCFSRKGKIESTTEMMQDFAGRILENFAEYVEKDALQRLEMAASQGVFQVPDEKNEYHGTRYFFNNDTLISKNENRYFYFNTASSRCKGVECAHEMADKRNFYIRDGSYVLLTDPESYEDVKGTYNPCHFPGITERDLCKEEILEETNWSGYNSIHNFAGGLGDGSCGAAGFIYEKNQTRYPDGAGIVRNVFTREMMGVKAHKAVFVKDDLFIFLGAGIEDKRPDFGRHIVTTVNNVRLKDGYFCDETGRKAGELLSGTYEADALYLYNDGCLYGIRLGEETCLRVHAGDVETDWNYLNFLNKDVPDERLPVLELLIDHKEAPVDSTYAYWISTSQKKTPEQIEREVQIMSNTKELQVVQFGRDQMMAVCYQPAKIHWDQDVLQVSEPCVLMAERKQSGDICISLSDPCQNKALTSVKITWNGKETEVPLPTGILCGSPGRVQLRKK